MMEKVIDEATQAPGAEPETSGFTIKAGNTTFLVGLYFSETSKDTLEDKVKKLAKKDVEDGNF